MKKLMMFAAAMTIVGSAFAEVAVYDYKATVKNVNLKKANIRVAGVTETVLIKFVESTSLYGYLVNSCDNCGGVVDNGKGYLVVANKKYKIPYIVPADLKVKWWNPKINATKTYEAEGYLFAGKGKAATPWQTAANYTFGDDIVATAGATRFLFGTYNDYVYDATPAPVAFFDVWLDAAGFGKALSTSTDGGCGVGNECTALNTLSGSVIGGLYICHPNGYVNSFFAYDAEGFLCVGWDGTSDVISGTWSIKRNTKFLSSTIPIVAADGVAGVVETLGNGVIDELVNTAAKKIKPGYRFSDTSVAGQKQNGLVHNTFAGTYAY